MSVYNDFDRTIVLTQAQFLARQKAGTLESGCEYQISDANMILTQDEFYEKLNNGELLEGCQYEISDADMCLTQEEFNTRLAAGTIYEGCRYNITDADFVATVKINGTSITDSNGVADITVIDNVTSTSTTSPLSANMGKELQDQITNLQSVGRFLSIWNCATGLPNTNPTTSPYTYKTGDYYRVGTVAESGSTNYKPNGSTYTSGVASTTVETGSVEAGWVYYYDGTSWLVQSASSLTDAITDVKVNGTSVKDASTNTADVPLFSSSAPGVVPASGSSSTLFLRGDGTWASPGATASAEPAVNALDAAMEFTIEYCEVFEEGRNGFVPGPTEEEATSEYFLRGDGTWGNGSYTLPIATDEVLGGIKSQTGSGTACPVVVDSSTGVANAMVSAAGIGAATSNHTHLAAAIPGFAYTTTAPTEANTDGMKVVVLSSEPTTKYDGWLYIITS